MKDPPSGDLCISVLYKIHQSSYNVRHMIGDNMRSYTLGPRTVQVECARCKQTYLSSTKTTLSCLPYKHTHTATHTHFRKHTPSQRHAHAHTPSHASTLARAHTITRIHTHNHTNTLYKDVQLYVSFIHTHISCIAEPALVCSNSAEATSLSDLLITAITTHVSSKQVMS